MASRAPLLGAAALFLVGAAGLLATFPGRDAVRTFVPLFRSESVPAPLPVSRISDATIPERLFPVDSPAVASEEAPSPTAAVESHPAAVVQATVTPAPEVHSAVVAAVASDPEPPAAIGSLRVVMVSSGEDAPSPGDATVKDGAEHEPSAGESLPVSAVTPTPVDGPASEPASDLKTGSAQTATPAAEHAPADSDAKHDGDHPKAEHEPSDKEKPESKSGSAHD